MSVKLETDTIRTLAAFEKMTKVHARDCLVIEDSMYFLVNPSKIGVAIGKNGSNIREVSRTFGKNVKLFPYHDSAEEMIKAMVPSAKSVDMGKENISLTVPASDRVSVIGRNGRNIKAIKELMNRHFSIKSVKLK